MTMRLFACIPFFMLGVHPAKAGPETYQAGGHGMISVSMINGSFGAMDANGDGIVERSEFNDYYSRQFDALDANKDGKLTLDEVNAGREIPADNSATAHLDKRFYAADVNHDGGLDRKEAEAMPMLSMYFDEVDANKDGKVTRQEYFDAMPLLYRAKQDKANSL